MNDETTKWLNDQARNYKACIMAVLKNIPPKLTDELTLSAGELKDIAGSLFIQGHKAGVFRTEDGDPAPPRYADDKKSSDGQHDLITKLAKELGDGADDIVDQHLRMAGIKMVPALTMSEATNLIRVMKKEKANRKKA